MIVIVTLTSPGVDVGPFNLFSNVNLVTPLVSSISRAALIAGYTLNSVPDAATFIRVTSTGTCTNSLDINIVNPAITTTTSTTTNGGTTTSTTTVSTPTTTTTTTNPLTSCQQWRNDSAQQATISYTPCGSTTPINNYVLATTSSVCAVYGSVTVTVGSPLTLVGSCSVPTTTTTTTTNTTPTTTTTSTRPITTTTTTTSGGGGGTTTTSTTRLTTTTTTTAAQQWYQITNCSTSATTTTAAYPVGTFAINARVNDLSSNVYRITAIYSSNPGGAGLFIGNLGATGCPSVPSTTTTTTQPAFVATNILVIANTAQGPSQDCLGTFYPVDVTTVTATLYNQYGAIMNAVNTITVTVNASYNPCYGGSTPTIYTITINAGSSSGSVNWNSSATVDCGQNNCVLETITYDCAASNTASLPFRAGTITC